MMMLVSARRTLSPTVGPNICAYAARSIVLGILTTSSFFSATGPSPPSESHKQCATLHTGQGKPRETALVRSARPFLLECPSGNQVPPFYRIQEPSWFQRSDSDSRPVSVCRQCLRFER